MTSKEEKAYIQGSNRAWMTMLAQCMRELGDFAEHDQARAVAMRAETIAALRSICAEFGDNDWPDNLHPADVIEKHLARHLREDF